MMENNSFKDIYEKIKFAKNILNYFLNHRNIYK